MKNTLIKSILFAGTVLVSQASFALYFDAGLGSSNIDAGAQDDSDTYLKLGVGAKFAKNLAWEAGYLDMGTDANVDGLFGNIKAFTKINSDTELFGKVGLYMWNGAGDSDGNDLFFGGGVTFLKIGPGNINLEILMGDLDDADGRTIGGSYSIPLNL